MSTQGGVKVSFQPPSIACQMQIEKGAKRGRKSLSSDDLMSHSSSDTVRIELLRTIKNRIKSGFYGSESVIEDLGQSFARVLDSIF